MKKIKIETDSFIALKKKVKFYDPFSGPRSPETSKEALISSVVKKIAEKLNGRELSLGKAVKQIQRDFQKASNKGVEVNDLEIQVVDQYKHIGLDVPIKGTLLGLRVIRYHYLD